MKISLLSMLVLIAGCSSAPKKIQADNPLETYRIAKNEASNGEEGYYSLEYLKSEASQYLLSQGKTDLKAGNSVKAVQQLKQARELNPWNDDIKDMFLLAISTLIKTTKSLSNEKCELVSDRFGLIYSAAPDQISELSFLTEKCNFKLSEIDTNSFLVRPIADTSSLKGSELESLNDQIAKIVAANGYVPRKELLLLQLNYLSDFSFNLGKLQIGSESTDKERLRVLVPIKATYSGKISSKEFCQSEDTLLVNRAYEKEVLERRLLDSNIPGIIECRHTESGRINKIVTTPSWVERVQGITPLPRKIKVNFVFNYNNGTTKIYKDLVRVELTPYNVEVGYGQDFDFKDGDLPVQLRYSTFFNSDKRYRLQDGDNFLEFFLPSSELIDLKRIDLKIDYQGTFDMHYNQKVEDFVRSRQISPN